MKRAFRLLSIIILFCISSVASDFPTCTTTTIDNLNGTTCQIGNLVFTFVDSPSSEAPPLFVPDSSGSGFTLTKIPPPIFPPETGAVNFSLIRTADGSATITAFRVSLDAPSISDDFGFVAADLDSGSEPGFNAGCIFSSMQAFCDNPLFPSPVSQLKGGSAIYDLGTSSAVAGIHYEILQSCQVNIARFGQCTITQLPKHWGLEQYAFHFATTICRFGCYLSSLSMALNATNIGVVPTCAFTGTANDPGHLNDFMTCNRDLLRYTSNNDVDPWVTVLDLSIQLKAMQAINANKTLVFTTPSGALRGTLLGDNDPARDTLDKILCEFRTPVVVKVTHCANNVPQCGPHFVLVTGKKGNDYTIADPSRSNYKLLSKYLNDPIANLIDPDSDAFVIRGFVQDPQGNTSDLNVSIGSSADFLLVDPTGLRTGFDSTSGADVRDIPQSVHSVDALIDDETGQLPGGKSHTVNVFQPLPGKYTVTVAGFALGQYEIGIRAYSQDGSAQPPLINVGIAGIGSASFFQIQFDSSPGSSSRLVRVASFNGTLADINNSLQLGLIDNAGIANALTSKIQAAAAAASSGQNKTVTNILSAFQHQVSAQTGKHITGVAPRVLKEDAASLINQSFN